ncbi:MAG: sugar-binding domain-containing protein, partial [Spirochaetales bacterium]|nr:sugar-binding domain-containing protein [Spirochaetales bacterium]
FYSIVGYSGTDNPYLQASIILDNFSRPFNGRCHYNNFPICIDHKNMTELEKSRFEELKKTYQFIDTAVISIGGSLNMDYPYLEEFLYFKKNLDTSEALSIPHGNLLGHVFYDKHEKLVLPERYSMTSMPLEILEEVKNVICIANGERKVDALISAAKQGYIKSLITDEPTAKAISMKLDNSI